MTTGSPHTARMPRDVRARERLREAQQQEAQALAAVCAAQDRLAKADAKRNAVLAAATAKVGQAQAGVDSAQGALVRVSGLDRAALLLGIDPAELRKIAGARNGRRTES
ncbi:MAG TPA: hypothetical protein VE442_15460 [Jatrophihabitans sp.]|jgi:hypothetical protein|nr:hypothetical protein [Jatrophihabitans sp.]